MGIESLPPLRLCRHVEFDERTSLGQRVLRRGAALLVMGLTVVAQYPAMWAAEHIVAVIGYRILLVDSQGTIWHGSVTLALTAGDDGIDATMPSSRLSRSIDMLPLLTDTLRVHLAYERTPEEPVTLTVTLGHWDAEAGMIALPASPLEGVGVPLNVFRLDG